MNEMDRIMSEASQGPTGYRLLVDNFRALRQAYDGRTSYKERDRAVANGDGAALLAYEVAVREEEWTTARLLRRQEELLRFLLDDLTRQFREAHATKEECHQLIVLLHGASLAYSYSTL
jgi:hypothetical protein